jgi:hypothetical protein
LSKKRWLRRQPAARFSALNLGVELSRCAEQNEDSIEYIIRIELARLKKDVMEHHNDKEISMEYIQITQYILFKTALQLRANIKKTNFYSIPINMDVASAKSNKRFMPCKQRNV